MTGPAYHARTHGPGGTDPVWHRVWLQGSTAGTQSVVTQDWNGISVRYTPMVIQATDIFRDDLGIARTGSPTGTTIQFPTGFYTIYATANIFFPTQVATQRMVGISIGNLDDSAIGPIPPYVPIRAGAGVADPGLNPAVLAHVEHTDDTRDVSFSVWEDEVTSSYRSNVRILSVSLVRFGEATP